MRLLLGGSPQRYARLGAGWLKRVLPELGALFGGRSKSRLPRRDDPEAVYGYIRETRRAEWVHWLSCLTPAPLLLLAPAWQFLLFATITGLLNGSAIIVLRYNRLRLYQVLDGLGSPRAQP